MVAAAGFGTIAGLVAQERRAQLVEPGTAYSKMVCGGCGVEGSSIEVAQNMADKFGRQPMEQLFLFTPEHDLIRSVACANFPAAILVALPPNPRSFTHGANGLDACRIRTACKALRQHAVRRQKPLWRRLPLRLLSSRAVSCRRRRSIASNRLIASQLPPPAFKIRFCSGAQSGFEQSLSGFVQAPSTVKLKVANADSHLCTPPRALVNNWGNPITPLEPSDFQSIRSPDGLVPSEGTGKARIGKP